MLNYGGRPFIGGIFIAAVAKRREVAANPGLGRVADCCHGMSSSMRACGHPLMRYVAARSIRDVTPSDATANLRCTSSASASGRYRLGGPIQPAAARTASSGRTVPARQAARSADAVAHLTASTGCHAPVSASARMCRPFFAGLCVFPDNLNQAFDPLLPSNRRIGTALF